MSARDLTALSKAQRAQLTQFTNITGASDAQGLRFLRGANWSVDVAADAFFESGEAAAGGGRGADDKREAEFARLTGGADKLEGDAVLAFCEELGIDPYSDNAILIVSWHMGCENQGEVSKTEFVGGLRKMGVETVAALKAKLPELRAQLADLATLKRFAAFAYAFSCEDGQKSPAPDVVRGLLPLVFSAEALPLRDELLEFLQTPAYVKKSISKDTWAQLADFGRAVGTDLAGYDAIAESAPVLLDDFVEWARKKRGLA